MLEAVPRYCPGRAGSTGWLLLAACPAQDPYAVGRASSPPGSLLAQPALARASRAAAPVTHWDQDQMQSATKIPAIASASTACAAVTPDPH
jgi:hypothetical protein